MTVYYLKIMEGFTMDASFDNVQGLNNFHLNASHLFRRIDGVQLHNQTIKVEKLREIVPLLYLRNSAKLPSYKHILLNHIRTMLNFHLRRDYDDVISNDPQYPDCLFEGSKLGLDFSEFVDKRKCDTLMHLQQQFPIKSTIMFSKPTSSFWRNFLQTILWKYYLEIRQELANCGGTPIHGKRSVIPYHTRTLDFKSFKIEPIGRTLYGTIKDRLEVPSFWEDDD